MTLYYARLVLEDANVGEPDPYVRDGSYPPAGAPVPNESGWQFFAEDRSPAPTVTLLDGVTEMPAPFQS